MTVIINALSFDTNQGFSLKCNNIELSEGNIYALIGRNGAGKTSLVESVLGLRQCEELDVQVLGCSSKDLHKRNDVMLNVGAQIQDISFPDGLLVKDIVYLQKTLYFKNDTQLYDALAIADLENKEYGKCSVGEKRRVDLMLASSHIPKLLFLDEFTSGLDEKFKLCYIDWIKQHYFETDKVVVFTSHSAEEIVVSSHLVWLEQGNVSYFGEKNHFISTFLGTHKLTVLTDNNSFEFKDTAAVKQTFKEAVSNGYKYMFFSDESLKAIASDLLLNNSLVEYASIETVSEQTIFEFIGAHSAREETK